MAANQFNLGGAAMNPLLLQQMQQQMSQQQQPQPQGQQPQQSQQMMQLQTSIMNTISNQTAPPQGWRVSLPVQERYIHVWQL